MEAQVSGLIVKGDVYQMQTAPGGPLKGARACIPPSPEARADFKRTPFVLHRFELRSSSVQRLRSTPWSFGFGAFSEVVYRDNNYCRQRKDGTLEEWPDTIQRVVEGVMSIRKDWHLRQRLAWDEGRWQERAEEMALAFLKLECGPPGRGYFAMGTDHVYERGGLALANCAATKVHPETFERDFGWLMDCLMCGAGVGFEAIPRPYVLRAPEGARMVYVIPDTREGWVESLEVLLRSYMHGTNPVDFDYSEVRASGQPIKTFGGTSAGPEPLRKLHEGVRMTCERYVRKEISPTRLVVDVGNMVGVCVVVGNVRRSAEIAIGDPDDAEFYDLKDYAKYPERAEWGWMSNNSVRFSKREHFEKIPDIAQRISRNGEPGFINLLAMQRFARFGRERPDAADLQNPCGEIGLEDKEICVLAETYPARCETSEAFVRAAEIATFYASTVTLLPTHRKETNAVVSRNRRIGVSVSGVADWEARVPAAKATRALRRAYDAVLAENAKLAREAGVPTSIRCTTVKPSGTVALLAGVSPGGHYAIFEHYIRRKRVSNLSPFRPLLDAAGYPSEPDAYSEGTRVYEFPISQKGARTAAQAGMYEQALQLVMLQREWSDNSVSYTVTFDRRTEGLQLERLLAHVAPMVKSLSALPRDGEGEEQTYAQAPYEEISEREANLRRKMLKPIDWTAYKQIGRQEASEADKYCQGMTCEIPKREVKP
jgi:ribonucleoside-diphosphate reductase alpha chain